MNVWGTITILKKLSINNSFDFAQKWINSDSLPLHNNGLSDSETFNISFQINSRFTLQYFGNYFSPVITLQGTQSSYSFSNLAFKSDFSQKKYSLALSVDNPFRKSFGYQIKNDIIPNLHYSDITRFYDRGVRLIFNYNFGKGTNVKVISRKNEENDLKAKEGKGQEQGNTF